MHYAPVTSNAPTRESVNLCGQAHSAEKTHVKLGEKVQTRRKPAARCISAFTVKPYTTIQLQYFF